MASFYRWARSQTKSIAINEQRIEELENSERHCRMLVANARNPEEREEQLFLADAYKDAAEALRDAVKAHTRLRDRYQELADTPYEGRVAGTSKVASK